MKLGIYIEPSNDNAADGFDKLIEQVEFAEAEGFASVWIAKHDFSLAAAVAEVTEHIRVGVLANPALLHPLKTAEDASVLDLMSNGRLLFGANPMALPEELALHAIAEDESWPRFVEAMDIIVKSWTHDGFAYLGDYNRIPLRTTAKSVDGQPFITEPPEPPFIVPWQRAGRPFDYLSLQPKPLQVPCPPVFVSANHQNTARWAARMGYSLLLALPSDQQSAAVCAAAYWEELAQSGRRRDEVTLAIALDVQLQGKEQKSAAGAESKPEGSLSGSPEQVLEGIKALSRDTGAFHLLCRIRGDSEDQTAVSNNLHLLASEVRPRLEM